MPAPNENMIPEDSHRGDMIVGDPDQMAPAEATLPDVGESVLSFAVELQSYLKVKGYSTSDDFASRFFELASASDLIDGNTPALDYEPVFETLAVTNSGEHGSFHTDFAAFVKNRRTIVVSEEKADSIRYRKDAGERVKNNMSKEMRRADNLAKKIERLESEQGQQAPKDIGTKKARSSIRSEMARLSRELDAALEKTLTGEQVKQIPDMAEHKIQIPGEATRKQMKTDLMRAAKKAMKGKRKMEVMSLLDGLGDLLKKIDNDEKKEDRDDIDQMHRDLEQARKAAATAQQSFHEIVELLNQEALGVIEKSKSIQHRDEFKGGTRAVKALVDGDISLDRAFELMSHDEKTAVADYVRENARQFKTVMSRNIRTGVRRKIDMPATCKKACSTMGIPLELEFVKPHRNRAKLLMFLDISGSCRSASDMMLTFMFSMKEMFPGGCKTYAFVNSLYDVSEIFEASDVDTAARSVLNTIPTRGVYSDYNRPFSDFADAHMNEVTKDTVVFFIGDARNNRNPSSEENVKAIARRAKRAYWLNTEDEAEWDTADSIMGVYAQYMDRVAQVTTPGELIGFLMGAK